MNAAASSLTAELSSALDWWRLAGVDSDFHEDATDWLGELEPPAIPATAPSPARKQVKEPEPPPPKVERINPLGDNPPQDLDAFRTFWLEAPGLDAIGPRGRILPSGTADAALMVLVTDPEQGDSEHLLAGPQGQFLDRILAAMGLARSDIYLASALPRHTPMADTGAIAASGMDAVTLHHISLARPKRLIAFGSNIPPLLGHTLTKEGSSLREINQIPQSIPLMVCEGLESLMTMPRLKARFWRRWMEWSADQ